MTHKIKINRKYEKKLLTYFVMEEQSRGNGG